MLCGVVLTIGLGLLACAPQVPAQRDGQDDREQTDQGVGHAGSLPHLRAEVISVLSHDRSSFTQGLELAAGTLYEGTGLRGSSLLRATDLATGQVRRETRLPAELFGEGITITGDRIWQLTWQEGVALERDRETLAELRRVSYSGEGWGLCFDGSRLVMSDGSDRLTFRDPVTFAPIGGVDVRRGGGAVGELNELECVGGQVWANVWGRDEILRIDPASGQVTAVVDASGLLSPRQRAGTNVLNGIAAVPGTDEFLITGKYWPSIFRVRFVPS
ncbi:glutaminyl-peptide cyclotransferase [Saccharopolyspora phatthalungensis]|uniref:glutaminyl-peptide cyclotransferase n=1 Tax=Saccharopolyspora phatthalungensis TaxID=664693 RepID=UPI00161A0180|nr:glutaminyl-peptide cyclotransferase [Saccharopolyspora phatthalungensis]